MYIKQAKLNLSIIYLRSRIISWWIKIS